MTIKALKDAIERAGTWPEERQVDAAQMLRDMDAQHDAPDRLTNEQLAEVERRLADREPKFLTLTEIRARLTARGA
jgi:cell division septum initiation protein DivIVA